MYKIFGSSETFEGNIEEIAPIKLTSYNKKTYSLGEGTKEFKIVCASDTHSTQDEISIPKCDLFIIAGDLINHKDGKSEINSFAKWFENIDTKNKIIVGGNHDKYLESNKSKISEIFPSATYLEYNSFHIEEPILNIYGAPCTLRRNLFYLGNAFSLSGDAMKAQWEKIPSNIDILITHCPPYDILDLTYDHKHVGSKTLRNEICNRIQPKIHIFGHNHDSSNYFTVGEFKNGKECLFVNACVYFRKRPCVIEYHY